MLSPSPFCNLTLPVQKWMKFPFLYSRSNEKQLKLFNICNRWFNIGKYSQRHVLLQPVVQNDSVQMKHLVWEKEKWKIVKVMKVVRVVSLIRFPDQLSKFDWWLKFASYQLRRRNKIFTSRLLSLNRKKWRQKFISSLEK